MLHLNVQNHKNQKTIDVHVITKLTVTGNQATRMDKVKVMYIDSGTYMATQLVIDMNDADVRFDTYATIMKLSLFCAWSFRSSETDAFESQNQFVAVHSNNLWPKECNPPVASPRYRIQHLAGHEKSVTGED